MKLKTAFLSFALSTNAFSAGVDFYGKNLISNDRSIVAVSVTDDGYYALGESEYETIERYNVSRGLKRLSVDDLANACESNQVYLKATRMSDNEIRIEEFFRIRGGFFGDDMSDADYQRAADQHGKAGKVIWQEVKNETNQEACGGGFLGGLVSGGTPASAVGGCVGTAVGQKVIRMFQGKK